MIKKRKTNLKITELGMSTSSLGGWPNGYGDDEFNPWIIGATM